MMTSPADQEQPVLVARRPRVLLRDATDIKRLMVHLLRHWTIPVVDVRIDRLPPLDSQRAKDRFMRLAEDCNCLVGGMLAGITLLFASYAAWVSGRGWPDAGLVVAATVVAGLAGKGFELAATRVKLLLLLRNLRHRLAEAIAGRLVEKPRVVEHRTYLHAFNSLESREPHPDRIQGAHAPAVAERPKILIHEASDIRRCILHLGTHWTLPHIEIQAEALPRLIVERAQDRLVRLSAGYSYLLAGLLAAATFGGLLMYSRKLPEEAVMWTLAQDWSVIPSTLAFTLLAASAGWAIEILWVRARLLGVLLGLRRQMSRRPPKA